MHSFMHPPRFSWHSKLGALATAGVLTMLLPRDGFATLTISGISGASNVVGLTATTPAVFGGTAGPASTGSCTNPDNVNPCNNCYDNDALDDTRFVACNPSRIYPGLVMTFTLSSDSAESGTPIITDSDGTTPLDTDGSGTITKGNTGTVSIDWSELCTRYDASGSPCSTGFSETIKVGIDADGNGSLNDAEDDAKSVSIQVVAGIENLHKDCDTASENDGVCYFEVNPGDGKVKIKNLRAPPNFPQSTNVKFQNVVFFYSVEGFDAITPVSDSYSLAIESDDTTSFELASDRINGLANEALYYFKTAVQDEAMNIGYFTPDSLDKDCRFAADSTTEKCHIAKPGEVIGILADDVNCFIATAAYGSAMASQVETFRQFRNQFLLGDEWGLRFVRAYYKFGPIAARWIARSEISRAVARLALTPALGYAWLSLRIGAWTALLIAFALVSLPVLGFGAYRRRQGRNRAA